MQKTNKMLIITLLFSSFIVILSFAELPSSDHFIMQQWGITSGNDTDTSNQPQSTNYIITGSAVGIISDEDITSDNYIDKPGYYLGHIYFGILPPVNVTISVASGTVHLNWDPVSGADTYSVYSSADSYLSYESWSLEEAGITDTSWSEQADGMRFYYVKAFN